MSLKFYGGGGGNRGEMKTGIVFFVPQTCQAKITIGKGGAGGIGFVKDTNTGGFAKSGEPSMFVIDNIISIIAEGGHKGFDASDIPYDIFDINLTGGAGRSKESIRSVDYPATKGTDGFQSGGSPGTGGGGGAGGYSSGPRAENGENPTDVEGTGGNGGTGYGAGGGGGGYSKYNYANGFDAGRGGNGNSGCVVLWKL